MAVEPPLRAEHREELVWLLAQACELGHGLMCEYLVAQFSLKRSGAEGLTAEQLAHRADRLSGTAGLAQLAELATDLHGMARDIESA